jgi:hypothetical protein
MAIRRLPQRFIDYGRYARWVHASHALDGTLPALVPVIQALGRIDAELVAEDAAYIAQREVASASAGTLTRYTFAQSESLNDRVNLSALWLFGAYEAVRTLDKAIPPRPKGMSFKLRELVSDVKQDLARPRMLLAKHEPASKHKATDKAPATPQIRNGSIAWRVAPRRFVSRRALADSVLSLLERMKAAT